jgi:hypothetical protein
MFTEFSQFTGANRKCTDARKQSLIYFITLNRRHYRENFNPKNAATAVAFKTQRNIPPHNKKNEKVEYFYLHRGFQDGGKPVPIEQ